MCVVDFLLVGNASVSEVRFAAKHQLTKIEVSCRLIMKHEN